MSLSKVLHHEVGTGCCRRTMAQAVGLTGETNEPETVTSFLASAKFFTRISTLRAEDLEGPSPVIDPTNIAPPDWTMRE